MISPELQKQLKDAGYLDHCPMHDEDIHRLPHPTLAQLLESIGEDFRSLELILTAHESWRWIAEDGLGKRGRGANPEEALARLFIAIHTTP